jgi:uncharacterized membrane protein (DUF373 family)
MDSATASRLKEDAECVQYHHPRLRRYFEWIQDIILMGLCLLLFAAMLVKLVHLCVLMVQGVDFSLVLGDVLFVLVLVELFRLLLVYLEEHRISVDTMVEVGIVSTLREIILKGPLVVDWRLLLVVCVFILTLGALLRFSRIRASPPDQLAE